MLPRNTRLRTTPVRGRPRKGWLLVGLIVLISAVILALVGITFYLTEHLRTTSLRQNQTRAIYLAQAGLMQAVYDYRFNDGGIPGTDAGYNLGQSIVIDGPGTADDVFFLEGIRRDFLLVNMKSAVLPGAASLCSASRHRLTGWRLSNILLDAVPPGQAVTIIEMAISWDPVIVGGNEGVIRIDLGGTRRWPTSGCGFVGPEPDPLPNPPWEDKWIDISDVTIASGAQLADNTIWFSNTNFRTPVSGGSGTTPKTFIDVKFKLITDNSIRIARFVNTIADRSSHFAVTSVGKAGTAQFPFVSCRRLQAEYEICGAVTLTTQCNDLNEERQTIGKLTVYRELQSECP